MLPYNLSMHKQESLSRCPKSECLEAVRTSEKPRHAYGTHGAKHCYLLNFLSANGMRARERPGTEWGYQDLVPSTHSQSTRWVNLCKSLKLAWHCQQASLTSRFFIFRWKIRQELTKLENLVLEGSTNLQKGLEKVRKARTTYGRSLSEDYHGWGSSYSRVTKFSSFLDRLMNRSKLSTWEVSCLPFSVE